MTATFGKLAFNFPLLSQVPGASEANKQFIGRKIGSFYHRITLRRPINLHLDCQYSIDRPIIASMELRKKSSGSISILHLSFSWASRGSRGYEIWTSELDYFLSFISFPRYTQQASLHACCNKYGKFILVIIGLQIRWLFCILEDMEKSKSCTRDVKGSKYGQGYYLASGSLPRQRHFSFKKQLWEKMKKDLWGKWTRLYFLASLWVPQQVTFRFSDSNPLHWSFGDTSATIVPWFYSTALSHTWDCKLPPNLPWYACNLESKSLNFHFVLLPCTFEKWLWLSIWSQYELWYEPGTAGNRRLGLGF